jgi:hypothetical protein
MPKLTIILSSVFMLQALSLPQKFWYGRQKMGLFKDDLKLLLFKEV